jgi:hypothetical protein
MKAKRLAPLLGVIFAGYLAQATPLELNFNLLSSKENIIYENNGRINAIMASKNLNFGEIPLKSAVVNARKIDDEIEAKTSRDLSYLINDKSTSVKIYDSSANGLSDGDFTQLNHEFRNGDSIKINLKCHGNDRYEINTELRYKDGLSATNRIDTLELNPILRFLIKIKTKPLIHKGQDIYNEITDDVSNGRKINLPYEDIRKVLEELDNYLPEIKKMKNEKQAFAALVKIYKTYSKIIDSK